MPSFDFEGHRLAYTIYGQGNPVILLHGQLLSQTMQEALARSASPKPARGRAKSQGRRQISRAAGGVTRRASPAPK
jgi:hypothetical protein